MIDDDSIDRQLRSTLNESVSASGSTLDTDPVAAVTRRVTVRHRRRQRRSALAVLAIVVAVAGFVTSIGVLGEGRSPDQQIDAVAPPGSGSSVPSSTGPDGSAPPAPTGPIVTDAGGVQVAPSPPLEVRGDAAVVWTGSELAVWGGYVEAFNMGLEGGDRSYNDGAAYSPVTGSWRPMSPSPLPVDVATPQAASTSGGVVFVRDRRTAVWDPDSNTWRSVDDAPATVRDLTSIGADVVSISANARLNVASGRWQPLAPPPPDVTLARATYTWTGSELVGLGGPGTPFASAVAVAYNPQTNSWRQLPDPPADLHAEALAASWDGSRVVVVNYDMRAVTYDPAADAWTNLPDVPARFGEWSPFVQSVPVGPATGSSVVLMTQAMVVLMPGDTWVPLPYGDVSAGPLVSGAGALFSWGLDWDTTRATQNRLVMVDPPRLVSAARRLQVGVGSIEMPPSFRLDEASYGAGGSFENAVEVQIDSPNVPGNEAPGRTGHCTVSSRYMSIEPNVAEPIAETLTTDGAPKEWIRNADSSTWQTAASTTDTFTVECDVAGDAEQVARSATFT